MDIIAKNPYRYLGVYSNSPIKERVANKGKMNAFLKVGQTVSFPLDFPNILPDISRSTDSVANAESQLTLPIDQIKFAQYWWMNLTPLDGIAFNHLMNGNTDMAKTIWDKKANVSSLQNNFVLSCVNEKWVSAIRYAEVLYTNFSEEFKTEIVGNDLSITTPLWHMLIDSFCEAKVNILPLMDVITNTQWRSYIAEKTINPLIDAITNAIETAKASRGKGGTARFQAGKKLITSTKGSLAKLKAILPTSDIRYQTIADKLATEILQCGIDYFNNSNEDDRATKAMELQTYAYTIAVGSMAKQRCKENVGILQKIIDELPPSSVIIQYKKIQEELRRYYQLHNNICQAVALLNSTKPYLDEMKSIVGSSNTAYVRLSTKVADKALYNIIEEVNKIQRDIRYILSDGDKSFIKNKFQEAWSTILLMGQFDMDSAFKQRYEENKRLLKYMCDQLGISPSSSLPPIGAIVLSIVGAAIGGVIDGIVCAILGAVVGLGFWLKYKH